MGLNILVQTRDVELFLLLKFILEREGYSASLVNMDHDPRLSGLTDKPDAAILDCVDGFEASVEFCRKIKQGDEKPIAVAALVGKEPADAAIALLNAGADAIVARPFDPSQLLRFLSDIQPAADRSRMSERDHTLRYADIEIDLDALIVRRAGSQIQLSPLHFRLLCHLTRKPGVVHSRDELIAACWHGDPDVEPRTVDIHMGQIRRALKVHGPDAIRTVRSAGYALNLDTLERAL